jgi:hypothetical protein
MGQSMAYQTERIRRYLIGQGLIRVDRLPGTRTMVVPGRPHGWLVRTYGLTPPDGHRAALTELEARCTPGLRPLLMWSGAQREVGRVMVMGLADDVIPYVAAIDQGGG